MVIGLAGDGVVSVGWMGVKGAWKALTLGD
jgi:hypothetical protein